MGTPTDRDRYTCTSAPVPWRRDCRTAEGRPTAYRQWIWGSLSCAYNHRLGCIIAYGRHRRNKKLQVSDLEFFCLSCAKRNQGLSLHVIGDIQHTFLILHLFRTQLIYTFHQHVQYRRKNHGADKHDRNIDVRVINIYYVATKQLEKHSLRNIYFQRVLS